MALVSYKRVEAVVYLQSSVCFIFSVFDLFAVVYSDYVSSLCSIYILRPYLSAVKKQEKSDGIVFIHGLCLFS